MTESKVNKKGNGKLWLWVSTIVVISVVVFLYSWKPAQKIFQTAEEQSINAGAYYYTELEQTYEAELHIRKALEKSPWNKPVPIAVAVGIACAIVSYIFYLGYKHLP